MGLLDSNKLNIQQKSGNFTCDLSSSASQNRTLFGGVSYKLLTIQVSGIANGTDTIITVKGCVADGSYINLQAYNAGGQAVYISANGIYYVDVAGLTEVVWQVTRQYESATATINWSVSNNDSDLVANGKLSSINENVSHIPNNTLLNSGSAYTFSTASTGDIAGAVFDNTNNCQCLVLNVTSITSGSKIKVQNGTNVLISYKYDGSLCFYITEPGLYYVPVDTLASIKLNNAIAVTDGSAQIKVGWVRDVPLGIFENRPIQKIYSVEMSVPSASEFTAILYSTGDITGILRFFKYYFISYTIMNGSSAAVRTVHIAVQPYHKYPNWKSGASEEISVESSYTYQTPWQEVRGEGLAVYVKVDNYSSGDKIMLNIYGVR